MWGASSSTATPRSSFSASCVVPIHFSIPPAFCWSHQQPTMFSLIFIVLVTKEIRVGWDIKEGACGLMIGTFNTLLHIASFIMLIFDAQANLLQKMSWCKPSCWCPHLKDLLLSSSLTFTVLYEFTYLLAWSSGLRIVAHILLGWQQFPKASVWNLQALKAQYYKETPGLQRTLILQGSSALSSEQAKSHHVQRLPPNQTYSLWNWRSLLTTKGTSKMFFSPFCAWESRLAGQLVIFQ